VKKKLLVIALALVLLVMAACSPTPAPPAVGGGAETTPAADAATTPPPAAAGPDIQIHFGGSSPGAMMYYMVGAFSTLVTPEVPGINITNVTTGAAFDNAIQTARGELDLGITMAMLAQELIHGTGIFDAPEWAGLGDELTSVARSHVSDFYFVVFRDSGIETIEDLNGRVVSTGPPGSGVQYVTNMVLDVLELDITREHLAFADTVFAMREGRIDALTMTGSPAGAVTELAETEDVIILPFTYELIDRMIEVNPLFFPGYMDAIYRGMDGPVLLPHFTSHIIANINVPDQVIYDMLYAAFQPDILEQMIMTHPNWRFFAGDIQHALDNGIPVHPGALRFFEENPWAPRNS